MRGDSDECEREGLVKREGLFKRPSYDPHK